MEMLNFNEFEIIKHMIYESQGNEEEVIIQLLDDN